MVTCSGRSLWWVVCRGVLGEDEQQLVMQADGLVQLHVDLEADPDVVRREPSSARR
jgi:hypothetical protein